MGNCFDDLVPLLAALGLSADLHRVGALSVYETTAGFLRDRPEWDLKRRHGILAEEISGDQAREREPALGPLVKHAILTPQWAHVSDPKMITDRLLQWLRLHGVAVCRGEALGADGRMLRTVDGGQLPFDVLIVAAGAWSARLARSFGDRVLLESERGYNTTLPNPGIRLRARGDLRGAQVRRHAADPRPTDRRCRRVRWPRSASQLRSLRGPAIAGGALPSRFASRWRHAMDGSSADDTGLLACHQSFPAAARRILRLRA